MTYNLGARLNDIDRQFGKAGCIPIVSTLTGYMRELYGIVEAIAGVAQLAFGFLSLPFTDDNRFIDRGFEHLNHGVLNIIRGNIEMIPILGNLIMLCSDNLIISRDVNVLTYGRKIVPIQPPPMRQCVSGHHRVYLDPAYFAPPR